MVHTLHNGVSLLSFCNQNFFAHKILWVWTKPTGFFFQILLAFCDLANLNSNPGVCDVSKLFESSLTSDLAFQSKIEEIIWKEGWENCQQSEVSGWSR